jgi:hypothetical protein
MAKTETFTGLDGAVASIKNAIVDLSSLEVITFRGSVTGLIKDDLEWDKLMTKATASSGQLKVAIATVIDFDCDVKTFIADDTPPQWILDAHNAAVKSGIEARRAVLDLVGGFLMGKK